MVQTPKSEVTMARENEIDERAAGEPFHGALGIVAGASLFSSDS